MVVRDWSDFIHALYSGGHSANQPREKDAHYRGLAANYHSWLGSLWTGNRGTSVLFFVFVAPSLAQYYGYNTQLVSFF